MGDTSSLSMVNPDHSNSRVSVDLALYMPSYKTVSVYWMKDLLSKKKKAIKSSEV